MNRHGYVRHFKTLIISSLVCRNGSLRCPSGEHQRKTPIKCSIANESIQFLQFPLFPSGNWIAIWCIVCGITNVQQSLVAMQARHVIMPRKNLYLYVNATMGPTYPLMAPRNQYNNCLFHSAMGDWPCRILYWGPHRCSDATVEDSSYRTPTNFVYSPETNYCSERRVKDWRKDMKIPSFSCNSFTREAVTSQTTPIQSQKNSLGPVTPPPWVV